MNVLADDWLYTDASGQPEAVSLQEARKLIKPRKASPLKVSFIDCEISKISPGEGHEGSKEALIDAAFPQDYIIQEEQLVGGDLQVIGAKKEKIKDVLECFKPILVDSLVPYPVALRAFLRNRNLLPEGKQVVFVDDLKTQAIVTVLSGMHFTAPRRISTRDSAHLTAEVRRTQQAYAGSHALTAQEARKFVVVANNREWLDMLKREPAASDNEYVYLDVPFPVLEGLNVAKFGMHFCLPSDLAERRKRELRGARLKSVGALVLSGVIGLTLYMAALIYDRDAGNRLSRAQAEEGHLGIQLQERYRNKFGAWLKSFKEPSYAGLYYHFAANVPYGYAVKEFVVDQTAQGRWVVRSSIYPMDRLAPPGEFLRGTVFKKAQITNAVINKLPGQDIVLNLTQDSL